MTFVAAAGSGDQSVEMRYEDENIWLTQKMMATLYDVSVQNIGQHIKKIFEDDELSREATILNLTIPFLSPRKALQNRRKHGKIVVERGAKG